MTNDKLQTKILLGSTLKAIDRAKLDGTLELKGIKVANIVKKLKDNLITDDECKLKALDSLFTKLQNIYNLCYYRNKISNNLQNNMAVYTININAQPNQRPTVGDGSATIAYDTDLVFTRALLTTSLSPQYNDPEGDAASMFRVVSLPVRGLLTLNSIGVSPGDEIDFADIDAGLFVYESSNLVTTADTVFFDFNISDVGSNLFALTGGEFTINIQAQVNQPPSQLGDGTSTIEYGSNLTFTRALLTTMLTPAYVDPEGDAAQDLRVNTLPVRGNLQLNGTNISANQVISFTDIDAGLLIYVSDLSDTDGDQVTFNFSVSDVGSGQFIT